MWTCEKGHLEIVRLLIDKGADLNTVHPGGCTALMLACQGGYLEVASLVIEKGAKIDAVTKNEGMTALMFASHMGHTPLVRLLLAKDANKYRRRIDGRTAFCIASTPEIKFLLS